jgi:hypothetical protein
MKKFRVVTVQASTQVIVADDLPTLSDARCAKDEIRWEFAQECKYPIVFIEEYEGVDT